VDAAQARIYQEEASLFTPDLQLVLLTWATFFALLAVLYKFAWKPILAALDLRERQIRESVEHADKVKEQFERLEVDTQKALVKAETQAREIIAQARKASINAANVIEEKAREEARIILENAQREIRAELEKAKDVLKKESAEFAILIAEKIIEQNLRDKHNREFVDKLIKEI